MIFESRGFLRRIFLRAPGDAGPVAVAGPATGLAEMEVVLIGRKPPTGAIPTLAPGLPGEKLRGLARLGSPAVATGGLPKLAWNGVPAVGGTLKGSFLFELLLLGLLGFELLL